LYEGILPEISKILKPQKLENSSLEFEEIGNMLKENQGLKIAM